MCSDSEITSTWKDSINAPTEKIEKVPNKPKSASPVMHPSGTQNIVTVTRVHPSQGGARSEKQSVQKAVVSATASSKSPNLDEAVGYFPLHSHNLQTEVKTKATPTACEAAVTTILPSSPLPVLPNSYPCRHKKVPPIIMCDQFE